MLISDMKQLLTIALQSAYPDIHADIELTHPIHTRFGDFTTSIAMKMAKELKRSPMSIADTIVQHVPKHDAIEQIATIAPGYINITLTASALMQEARNIIDTTYGYLPEVKRKKILLEFGQPNTHKLPHIGHLFSYIFGESLARILLANGHNVTRLNYQGDVGLHVAKCMYALRKTYLSTYHEATLEERIKLLQKSYQEGSALYSDDPIAKQEIDALNGEIYKHTGETEALWQETRSDCLTYYTRLEKSLGVAYVRSFFESESSALGKDIVLQHVGTVFENDNGTIIYDGKKAGYHTRVFINKLGNPTYEGKDMGLVTLKKRAYEPFDLSLITTAKEQDEYFNVVFSAASEIYPDLKGKLKHIGFGMINLTTGKISSRSGQIIDAVGLRETVKRSIKQAYNISDDTTLERIAHASIAYSFLKSDALSDIAFDLEKSISQTGSSGPYLLYSYVRCKSILQKAGEVSKAPFTIPHEIPPEERELLQKLYRYPEMVQQAGEQYAPHVIITYLFDLAQTFSTWYENHQILNAPGEIKAHRLELVSLVAEILKNGMYLIGVEVVEKM